ncbi:2-dehydro-3-deoxy-6-phosphogalactonate aldolase [Sphingomonas mollis]|uniref:2-dehydro-3-deoxy-6-phosphogalactonate aldolase n=1 Tax=Sphingomonas mollis TaxID=2795726 RepID=A0ABS0XTD1_9SPHN|nr:2-dehydro-3-deoxy-6-phosphogalactonate aldolase [Sphingomonas sp. BT553]MBJ6123015.1 2-dehydro-3-deoxy-6-phosphogalactonate aldolase [Sphingomonas sp. BT553]
MTTPDIQRDELRDALTRCPLVAILRGITPPEVDAVGDALVDAGFSMIEVPLNSPDPFTSIARLVARLGDRALVGAGTVLTVEDVARLRDTGARLMISPNTNPAVITAAADAGLIALPGYFTPSEAFVALAAGAAGLKLFPAEAASPSVIKAHRAVLPKDVPILAVGGMTPDTIPDWREACDGFGLGSALYKPGQDAADVARQATRFVEAVAR